MKKRMKHLMTHTHPEILTLENKTIFTRNATRAICLQEDKILLLFTERYNDYSLPGGGLDKGEDLVSGMKRELSEETGACNARNVKDFGVYEEYRPWYKPDFDIQHMISYCFTCDVDQSLKEAKLESYEKNNGMKASWINIQEAIAHNEKTIAISTKKGMSVQRETFLLKLILNSIKIK